MMTEAQVAHMEKRLDREIGHYSDEQWEADERARFDSQVNAIADRFEEG